MIVFPELLVALTGSAVYLMAGIVVLTQMGLAGNIPLHLIPWFLVFIVMLRLSSPAEGKNENISFLTIANLEQLVCIIENFYREALQLGHAKLLKFLFPF